MANIVSKQSRNLKGTAYVPGDKSISHRALMFGAIAKGESKVTGLLEGEDVLCTAAAMRAMGASIEKRENAWHIQGTEQLHAPEEAIYLGNSGTSARLLMGLVGGYNINVEFTGDHSLSKRPMQRVITPLEQMGITFESDEGKLPLTVKGNAKLKSTTYTLPVASAQVKSAILLSGLHAEGTTTVIEPLPTRDHTERMLSAMGANITTKLQDDGSNIVTIEGFPTLTAQDVNVPADPSSAAFLTVATLILPDSELLIPNVLINPRRDGIFKTLMEMGGNIRFMNTREVNGEEVVDLHVSSSELEGVEVPAERVPSMIDEFPILSVAASFAKGKTTMTDLAELRVKESDRLSAMAKGLAQAGVKVEEGEDSLVVYGSDAPKGGCTIHSQLDHRIAMSFAIMGMATQEPITIEDTDTINTSFPGFVELVNNLGGQLQEIKSNVEKERA